jgi:phosphate-selective porin
VDWTLGPGSLRAEYTHVTDERLGQSYTDSDLSDARYQSWYVQGTWLLTGEPKTRPVKPALDFPGGGVGAVELTGRYDRIWFDSVDGTAEAFANPRAENILLTGERAVTLGVNWTLNRFIKLQFNAIREHVDNPDRSPVPNGSAFWSRVIRLQMVL